jgi:predicted transcriptional regulator of viral defense system
LKISISDPHKTILDMLGDPYLGAGLQHTFDCFKAYLAHSDKDLNKVLEYAVKIDNGALFKKLGYFGELNNLDSQFISHCQKRLTKGYSRLDNASKHQKLVTRWRLWVPQNWTPND